MKKPSPAVQSSPRRTRLHGLKKHPFVIPVLAFISLVAISMVAFVMSNGQPFRPSTARTVYVTVAGEQQAIPTQAATVKELLERMEVELQEGDVVEPALDTEIVEDGYRVNVYRARDVLVTDGVQKITTRSAAPSPRTVAGQVGIETFPEDIVERAPIEDFVRDGFIGEKVVITKATPVSVNLYGTAVTIRTHAKTVGDLLKEKNITLAGDDTVQPAHETPISSSVAVFVVRAGTQIATVEEVVPAPSEIVEDNSLSFGTQVVRQRGVPGKKLVTYQIELVNGQETGRRLIQEVVVQEPLKQITARGKAIFIPEDKAALMTAAGIAPSDHAYANYIISRENALWCPTRWQGQRFCPPYYEEIYPGAESSKTANIGYGVCQATNPVNKMAVAGEDWRTNLVTQLRWCQSYAHSRYGSWQGAYEAWLSKSWW